MAIDIGMQMMQCEWRVCDIKGTVKAMRRERGGSVQTAVQYRFIHQALLEYVTPGIGDHSMFGAAMARSVYPPLSLTPLPHTHNTPPLPVCSYLLPQLVGTRHLLSIRLGSHDQRHRHFCGR